MTLLRAYNESHPGMGITLETRLSLVLSRLIVPDPVKFPDQYGDCLRLGGRLLEAVKGELAKIREEEDDTLSVVEE